MKYFFLILGWAILFAVLMMQRLVQPMSDSMVIILCVISAVFLSAGTLIKNNKKQKNI